VNSVPRRFGGPSVLFDLNGALASCAVRRFGGARLRSARESAGLMIIDVSRLEWEAPHRVTRTALGEDVDEVPSSVVEWGMVAPAREGGRRSN